MWATNLKIVVVGLVVIGFYTFVAHIIPQLESEVPEDLAFGDDVTPEALVTAGERIFNGAGGCTACHGLGTRAPNLLTDHGGEGAIGARCDRRVDGLDCKTYLYQALTNPGAYVVRGFDNIMTDMRRQGFSEDQVWAVVAFLETQGGEVTVTAADIRATSGPETAAQPAGPARSATTDPRQLLLESGCLGCHQIDGQGPPIGPSFDGIGRRRDAAWLRRKILNPGMDVSPGFEQFAGMMPATFGDQLSATQLEAMVSYLAARR